jgi:hypothetical protein
MTRWHFPNITHTFGAERLQGQYLFSGSAAKRNEIN